MDVTGRKEQVAGVNYTMRSFIMCYLHQIKEEEMNRTCRTHARIGNT